LENPWGDLPAEPPYVLPIDHEAVAGARDLQLDALPVPYVGDPAQAAVYILALNPGLAGEPERISADAREQNRLGLTFASTYPFWSLDPRLAGTGGYEWWRPRLQRLADEVGWDVVHRRVMCVQYLPYHSRTFSASRLRIPSQRYSFWLVSEAARSGKVVVIARGHRLWTGAVPELLSSECVALRNPRAVFLTPRNMGSEAFGLVVNRLRQPRP